MASPHGPGSPAIESWKRCRHGSTSGNALAVSVGTVQTSVTDGTFESGAAGIMIQSSGGSTAVHKADDFQATLH